jgi:Domain of unknown function DUF1828
MTAIMPCELISRYIGELYKCSQGDDYIAIRTPYIFPDGDIIELYYQGTGASGRLTDFGETLRWLGGQTPAQRRTKKHLSLIEDTCSTHHVELVDGQVSVNVGRPEAMAEAITRLAQATIRIADVSFTFRSRAYQSFADEVEELLVDKQISFERNAGVEGESGELWPIDFRTVRQARTSLVYVLSTGSRGQAKRLTDHVVAAFYDLRKLRDETPPINLISLVDDDAAVWEPEDFKRLESLSKVAAWSRPDDFIDSLAA